MLTWNGLEVTQNCIASLRERTKGVDYQLVVVDNGSSDGTLEWLRAQPDIKLIANQQNLGFTRGNNQGIAAVPPEHDILLLNNDTIILQDHWLAHLREVANSHPDYGVVGCTLLRADGDLQHAGTYMPVSNFWGYQIGGGEPFVGQYPGVREVEGVVGAAMYIRRDCRAAIGGLDEDYFSYFEDTDYCLRAQQAGFKVVCTGGTQIKHLENTSAKLNNVNWWKMFGAAQKIFLDKWRHHYDTERYTRALFWHSLHATPTGYATSSREFVLELDRRGVDVRLACIFGTDYTEPLTGDPRVDQLRKRPKDSALTQVVYSQGDAFTKNSGRYRVGYTMLEVDGLPYDWVVQANQMDEVWVPSTFNAQVFREAGVRRPIHTVPLGVDTNYFHPAILHKRPSARFVFLSIFEWIERKAPELLLRAYAEEFGAEDDTLLVLKVWDHHLSYEVPRQVERLMAGSTARVALLLNQPIAAQQMGSFYRGADCFVLPTRGEGWGMPILEAMACGLPVIATDWGAQRDFFGEELGYPLRIKGLTPAIARSPYYAGLRWAEPDLEHLRALMRYVYEHPEEARATGARAAEAVAAKWTWAHATDKIMARLKAIEG
jgi:GT2 family glycosyltransferase